MFRTSSTSSPLNMFTNISDNLGGQRQKKYNDKNAWHNLFQKHITSAIDESQYKALFSKDKGSRPNAPVRVLLGMMILKEGFGMSDERLFEVCQFDLLMMKALGINNIDDSLPCSSTYYNLKKAIYEHQVETGEDLVGETFRQLTKNQAKVFGVKGEFARMDSKLIGSNIAKCSRLQLILSVLGVFYKTIQDKETLLNRLNEETLQQLKELSAQKPGQIVYKMDNPSKEALLEELGYLLMNLMEKYTEADSEKYHLIPRLLSEQYHVESDKVQLKEVKDIQADSLQSPHDEDAAYRKKGNGNDAQKVQGYSANLTETCNEEGLNLVTDVKVKKATAADNDFVEESVESTQEVVGHIDHLNADGAYHSEANQNYAEKNETELIVSAMQGKKSKYDLEVTPEGQLKATNTETGEIFEAEPCNSTKQSDGEHKWKINDNGKVKYFTYAFILSYFNRQRIESIPQSEKNRRNNVEASIFQLSYFTRKNKTRYRGLIKHQWWAFNRSLWMNLVRIKNYMGEVCPDGSELSRKAGMLAETALKNAILLKNFSLEFFRRNFFGKKFGSFPENLFICIRLYFGEVLPIFNL